MLLLGKSRSDSYHDPLRSRTVEFQNHCMKSFKILIDLLSPSLLHFEV